MSELEELEFDRLILRSAMENTYMILTGRATWDSLMDKASMQPGSVDQHIDVALLFDPMDDNYNPKFPHLHNDIDVNELFESMIDYYVESEEYEKCGEILKNTKSNNGTER